MEAQTLVKHTPQPEALIGSAWNGPLKLLLKTVT
jgi:hypothetical protein